jgi:hypothetical protein
MTIQPEVWNLLVHKETHIITRHRYTRVYNIIIIGLMHFLSELLNKMFLT